MAWQKFLKVLQMLVKVKFGVSSLTPQIAQVSELTQRGVRSDV